MMEKPSTTFYVGKHRVTVDAEHIPILAQYTWHILKSKQTHYAHTNVKLGGKKCALAMHRLLTGTREAPIDHKNRNGLDNRISNLRYCTSSQNSINHIRKNKYGYRGVHKPKGTTKYAMQIKIGETRIHRYGFKTAEEAAREYDRLSKEHHGEFGIRNFKD
jgi:hypothetical protein